MKARYHIISKIASGGTGTILHAWDNAQSRDVAIKRLNGDGLIKDYLLREARSLYTLRHPNIVTIHEYDSDEEGAYMVMELIKGDSLEKRLEKGPLSMPEFKILVTKTLDAISEAHEVGIIHRDLTPENIMLPWNAQGDFEVKIIDFGLSQQLPPEGGAQDSMVGSIHFMAPEQFGSGHVDVRTDLYALGCIYYFALTGKYPFPGEAKHQVITAHLYPPKIPLGEARPDLDDRLCNWVQQLLNVQPHFRPATAADALAAFKRLGPNLQILTASGVDEPEYMVLEEEEMPAVLIEEDPEEEFTPLLEVAEEEEEVPVLAAQEEDEAELQAEMDIEAETEVQPEAEIEAEAEVEPEPETEVEAEAEAATEVEADSEPEPDPKVEAPAATAPIFEPEPEAAQAVPDEPEPEPATPAPEPEEPTPAPEPPPAPEPLPAREPEPEPPVMAAPTPIPAPAPAPVTPQPQPQPHYAASPEPEPEPGTARRLPVPPTRKQGKRRTNLQLIVTAFVVILVVQFALVSYFKYAGREAREQRLEELSESEQAEGSDVDVRMLLDFLADPAHQEQAAKALSKLQGGGYIDEILNDHLEKNKKFPVCARLLQVIGQRRSTAAFGTVLELTGDARGDVRQAAWTALGRITPADSLPRVLAIIGQSNRREHPVIEKSLISAIESATDRELATRHTLQSYRKASQAESRTLLFNVLTRVGGSETLDIVTEAINDPVARIRLAAIKILAEYPTHEPLAAITARFPDETDDECRVYLLLAARELINSPGPSSQQMLFRHAQKLYANAQDDVEKSYVLSVLSRIIAPGTAKFFEDFSASADASLKGEARELATAFRDKLKQVVTVPPGDRATLPAEKADYRLGSSLVFEEDALIYWTQEGDWASWLVELPRNGEYEIAIYQAHSNDQLGTYEILLAGQTLLTSVVKTEGKTDFKGFVIGNIQVDEPGIYRLRVRAKTVPAEGTLFRLQRLVVKSL